jgi:ABC-type transport system involved in multi-copper enzyme maturation permease subunit
LIIRKEITAHVLSLRFAVTFALFFGLLLISTFVMTNEYRATAEQHSAAVASYNQALNEVKAIKDPQQQMDELDRRGIIGNPAAAMTPRPLSIFAKGLTGENLGFSGADAGRYRNPLFSLFQTPDVAYVVTVVVSLLALLFVFDAVCGEKERGTLKLVLSNSVPRDILLLGKWIGGYVTLIIPFLVAFLAGLAYIIISGATTFGGEGAIRLGLTILIALLYISIFFTLGLVISTLTHRASTALLIALFVWVVWILIIPNIAPVIAKITVPVPTLQKITAEKEAINREIEIRRERLSRTTLGYGSKAEKMWQELQDEGKRRRDRLDNFHDEKVKTQMMVTKTLSRLSPSASFTYAATGLAETGTSLPEHLKTAQKRLGDEVQAYWQALWEKQNSGKLEAGWFKPEALPRLRVFDERISDSVNEALVDLVLMVIYNVLFFMGAYTLFLRYDVR